VSEALRAAPVDDEWDAGELGCGELVLALRGRMLAMEPGRVLRLIALDPGAPADIPAWCRLTGHRLLDHHHPVYLIRREES
jgi:tRNA 2-thiouridine synthesizing protein A